MEMQKYPLAYLNTAGCGLLSESSLATAGEVYHAFTYNSSGRSEIWREEEAALVRQRVARFMGVQQAQLGFIPNFSYGINAVIQSLRGDERVLLYRQDYPSVSGPFLANRFPVFWIDSQDGFSIDLNLLEEIIIREKIDILAISHVQWQTGFKISLEALSAICHRYGTLLFIDATQSLGAESLPIETLDIDVVLSSNYKWMNSGFGNGLIYLSPSFLRRYPPVMAGAASIGFERTVRAYEPGGLNLYGLTLLDEAIREKEAIGLSRITAENLRLTQTLLNGLAQLKDQIQIFGDYNIDNRASIVVLKDQTGDKGSLGDWIANNKIIVTQRGGTLRISFHFYNKPEQVKLLLEILQQWTR